MDAMRIWSLHPSLLDRQALVACWRETLLAQAVLSGRTQGYRHHPQLDRFRACDRPLDAIALYLRGLEEEARARGYHFDASRISVRHPAPIGLEVTDGQLQTEWQHLLTKLEARSPERFAHQRGAVPFQHPLFTVVQGPTAVWERA